MNGKIDTHRLK